MKNSEIKMRKICKGCFLMKKLFKIHVKTKKMMKFFCGLKLCAEDTTNFYDKMMISVYYVYSCLTEGYKKKAKEMPK